MAAIDLTSLAAAREFLQLQVSTTELDDVLEDTITACSRELMNELKREFAPKADAVARTLEFRPDPCGRALIVSLTPWDLRSATALVVDDGLDTEVTLTATQWEPVWHDRRTNSYVGVEIRDIATVTGRNHRTLTITGNWGLEEIPEDVALGCKLYVKAVVRSDVQAFGNAPIDDGDDARDTPTVGIPSRVLGMLGHYRRSFGIA